MIGEIIVENETKPTMPLEDWLQRPIWLEADESDRQQIREVAAVYRTFWIVGFVHDKTKKWMLLCESATPDRKEARELAHYVANEAYDETPTITRVWKIEQSGVLGEAFSETNSLGLHPVL